MDRNQFKIALLQRNKAISDVSKMLGISQNALYTRLQGKTQFTVVELLDLKDNLNLSKEEFSLIFPELMN